MAKIFKESIKDSLRERPPRGGGSLGRGKKVTSGKLISHKKLTDRLKTQAILARQRRMLLKELQKIEGVFDPKTRKYDLVVALKGGVNSTRLGVAFNSRNITAAEQFLGKSESIGADRDVDRPLQHQAVPFLDTIERINRRREKGLAELGFNVSS